MMNGTINEEKQHLTKIVDEESSISCSEEFKLSKQKLSSIKNLIIISISYLLYFLGFWGLSNLQSTINAAGGIGMDSQAVIYAVSMISSVLLPDLLIKKMGCKWVYVLSIFASCLYIASNFHVQWDFMMTASVIYGIASGPLNTAQSYYVDEMAVRYKTSDAESMENIMAGFFGIFMFFSENTQLWGNLMSYYILRDNHGLHHQNHSSTSFECGVNFNPEDNNNSTNPNLIPPSQYNRHLLVCTFLLCGIIASVISAIFLDPLGNDIVNNEGEHWWETTYNRVMAALKLMINPQQLLLVFIAIYCGIESAFYSSEFTQAFIACPLGIHQVGGITVYYGICGSLIALVIWPLVRCSSHLSVMIVTSCVNISLFLSLYLWNPQPGSMVLYVIYAGVWGMTDAIWWSQIAAVYGLMFPDHREAAFSNFFFWTNVGYFVSYSYANRINVWLKLTIMLVVLGLGVFGYLISHSKWKRSDHKRYAVIINEH